MCTRVRLVSDHVCDFPIAASLQVYVEYSSMRWIELQKLKSAEKTFKELFQINNDSLCASELLLLQNGWKQWVSVCKGRSVNAATFTERGQKICGKTD